MGLQSCVHGRPQSHQRMWLDLGIPRGLAHWELSAKRQLVSQQANSVIIENRPSNTGSSAGWPNQTTVVGSPLRGERGLLWKLTSTHLTAPEEPLQDLTGMLIELGTEQSQCFEFAFGILPAPKTLRAGQGYS
jgi:hypothetical protein